LLSVPRRSNETTKAPARCHFRRSAVRRVDELIKLEVNLRYVLLFCGTAADQQGYDSLSADEVAARTWHSYEEILEADHALPRSDWWDASYGAVKDR
jgi:hypothetical protein